VLLQQHQRRVRWENGGGQRSRLGSANGGLQVSHEIGNIAALKKRDGLIVELA
jgi:hypothetical protein